MEGLFPVYRLEEYGGLQKEGGGGLPVLLLRACSYKTKSEGWHQGNAPILFKGWISVFVNPYNHGYNQSSISKFFIPQSHTQNPHP